MKALLTTAFLFGLIAVAEAQLPTENERLLEQLRQERLQADMDYHRRQE